MRKWYSIFPNNPWLSLYVWVIFCLLPFFFIFRSSSRIEITIGISLLLLFFISYRFSFQSKSGLVYMWIAFEMVINCLMTLLFGFVYFALFTAFFIGNIRHTAGFFIMYGLHIATTLTAIVIGFFFETELFLSQFPFILVTFIGTVLLPFHLYNRNRRENLEDQLEDARERISELVIFEERQRIARDLHDILGQKLSLIGLKSDLAGKLIDKNPSAAKQELQDIRQTASAALNEVRELVSNIRSTKVEDELERAQQILKAAEMHVTIRQETSFKGISPIMENVLCLCLKEAVTNVVKHSFATACTIALRQVEDAYVICITDDGIGIPSSVGNLPGNGLSGMRERLEFVNGTVQIQSGKGTTVSIRVPVVLKNIGG